jgi:DNA-binding Lrp family transcriptional regulator
MTLDKRDADILKALQEDGRMTNAALAKRINTAEAPAWRRLRALETSGVIRGYRAVVDQRKLGLEVTAFVQIRFLNHSPDLQRQFEIEVQQLPEVIWCHNVSGGTDFLLCAVARSLDDYGQFVSTRLRMLPGVASIESVFSMKAVKDSAIIPVD